jgi:hypothetical protein
MEERKRERERKERERGREQYCSYYELKHGPRAKGWQNAWADGFARPPGFTKTKPHLKHRFYCMYTLCFYPRKTPAKQSIRACGQSVFRNAY